MSADFADFFLTACEQDLTQLLKECTDRTSLHVGTPLVFKGFEFEELQSLRMIRRALSSESADRTVRLLELNFSYEPIYGEAATPTVSVSMSSLDSQNIDLGSEIKFIIGKNRKPYIIKDMEMAVFQNPHYMGTHFGCYLSSYTINDLVINNTIKRVYFESIVINRDQH